MGNSCSAPMSLFQNGDLIRKPTEGTALIHRYGVYSEERLGEHAIYQLTNADRQWIAPDGFWMGNGLVCMTVLTEAQIRQERWTFVMHSRDVEATLNRAEADIGQIFRYSTLNNCEHRPRFWVSGVERRELAHM